MTVTDERLPGVERAARQFQISGRFVDAAPYGSGHINDTYAVRYENGGTLTRIIVQRVNHTIFKNVPLLMDNIQRVTDHVRSKLENRSGHDSFRETLTVIPTRDGASFYLDPDGNYWRAYIFIEGARTYDTLTDKRQAYEAAKAFGNFQKQLLDIPGPRLFETIPGFHHTPKRLQSLETAIVADACNRAAAAAAEIDFALARRDMVPVLVDLLEKGEIPERVTHNDTKINNVMLDDATGAGICVIDLDTVMPGLVLYDFGDEIRTSTFLGGEDDRNPQNIKFELPMFDALARGYLETSGEFLVSKEREFLAFSGQLITFEIGIRFLTDYLQGDTYFKTHRAGHNLERARVQFERVRQLEANADVMNAVITRYC